MIAAVMAISNLMLTRQIYSAEPDGAHVHNRDLVPLSMWGKKNLYEGNIL